jgi:hypothetical protein
MRIDIHVYVHDDDPHNDRAVQRIRTISRTLSQSTIQLKRAVAAATGDSVTAFSNFKLSEVPMSALDDSITDLTAKVEANTTVDASAIALISGFQARLDAAVAAASAAGASAAQLKSLTDLSAAIGKQTSDLSDAVSANTPAEQNP